MEPAAAALHRAPPVRLRPSGTGPAPAVRRGHPEELRKRRAPGVQPGPAAREDSGLCRARAPPRACAPLRIRREYISPGERRQPRPRMRARGRNGWGRTACTGGIGKNRRSAMDHRDRDRHRPGESGHRDPRRDVLLTAVAQSAWSRPPRPYRRPEGKGPVRWMAPATPPPGSHYSPTSPKNPWGRLMEDERVVRDAFGPAGQARPSRTQKPTRAPRVSVRLAASSRRWRFSS